MSKEKKSETKSMLSPVVVEQEISPVVILADKLVIKDEQSMESAVELLSQINKANDQVVTERERVTKPLNEALKAERSRWKPLETTLTGAIATVRGKIGAYQTQKTRDADVEAARIAARVGEGKGHLKVDTAVRKIDEIDKPAERIATDSGKLKFRTDKKLKVTDASKIPHEYFDLNESRLLTALKAGIKVEGAEIEEVQTPINSR